MDASYSTFEDLIAAFGENLADALGVTKSHAQTIKARKSIPDRYWDAAVASAARRGFQGVTLESLLRMKKARFPVARTEQAA